MLGEGGLGEGTYVKISGGRERAAALAWGGKELRGWSLRGRNRLGVRRARGGKKVSSGGTAGGRTLSCSQCQEGRRWGLQGGRTEGHTRGGEEQEEEAAGEADGHTREREDGHRQLPRAHTALPGRAPKARPRSRSMTWGRQTQGEGRGGRRSHSHCAEAHGVVGAAWLAQPPARGAPGTLGGGRWSPVPPLRLFLHTPQRRLSHAHGGPGLGSSGRMAPT